MFHIVFIEVNLGELLQVNRSFYFTDASTIICNKRVPERNIQTHKMVKKMIILTTFVTLVAIFNALQFNEVSAQNCDGFNECNDTAYVLPPDIFVSQRYPDGDTINEPCVGPICCVNFADLNCTACLSGFYGPSCANGAVCATGCSYSRVAGCNASTGTDKECNLLALTITNSYNNGTVYGNQFVSQSIDVNVTVNLDPDDVIVRVNESGKDTPLRAVENGVYTFQFNFGENVPGQYTFEARALINGTESNITDHTNVTVAVRRPVEIVSIALKYNNDTDEIEIGNTVVIPDGKNVSQLICSAERNGNPEIDLSWLYGGGRISEMSTGNGHMYQIKANTTIGMTSTLIFTGQANTGVYTCEALNIYQQYTFYDVRTVELTSAGSNPEPPSVERKEFIIAVAVLGVALLITIVTFTLVFVCGSKMHKENVKKSQPPTVDNVMMPGPNTKESKFAYENPEMQQPDNKRNNQQKPKSTEQRYAANNQHNRTLESQPNGRKSYAPIVRPPMPTPSAGAPRGLEHQQNPRQSYAPIDLSPISTPSAGAQRNMLSPNQVKVSQYEPSVYDEVAPDKPQLPPNHPTLNANGARNHPTYNPNGENIYLDPSEDTYDDMLN